MELSSRHPSEEEWVVAYEMSVRALSPDGEGPWLESFRGTTLEEGENCFVAKEK